MTTFGRIISVVIAFNLGAIAVVLAVQLSDLITTLQLMDVACP